MLSNCPLSAETQVTRQIYFGLTSIFRNLLGSGAELYSSIAMARATLSSPGKENRAKLE